MTHRLLALWVCFVLVACGGTTDGGGSDESDAALDGGADGAADAEDSESDGQGGDTRPDGDDSDVAGDTQPPPPDADVGPSDVDVADVDVADVDVADADAQADARDDGGEDANTDTADGNDADAAAPDAVTDAVDDTGPDSGADGGSDTGGTDAGPTDTDSPDSAGADADGDSGTATDTSAPDVADVEVGPACPDGQIESPPGSRRCIADPCLTAGCVGDATCEVVDESAVCVCPPGFTGATCADCTRYVRLDGPSDGDGLSWTTSWNDLANAVASVRTLLRSGEQDSCQLWIQKGTWFLQPGGTLRLEGGMALFGGFEGWETSLDQRDVVELQTVLDGRHPDESEEPLNWVVVTSADEGATMRLSGLVIQNGRAVRGGGDNKGGGIAHQRGSLELDELLIRGNHADGNGGGVYAEAFGGPSAVVMTDVRFEDNSSGASGGGLYAQDCAVVMSNVTFDGNAASESGGGAAVVFASLVRATGLTASYNMANEGGGLSLVSASTTLDLQNLEIVFNTARGLGGGLRMESGGTTSLTSMLLAGNVGQSGGAASIRGTAGTVELAHASLLSNVTVEGSAPLALNHPAVTIVNSLATDNAPSETAVSFAESSAPTVIWSGLQGWTGGGTGNLSSAPVFLSPFTTDRALSIDDSGILETRGYTPYAVGDTVLLFDSEIWAEVVEVLDANRVRLDRAPFLFSGEGVVRRYAAGIDPVQYGLLTADSPGVDAADGGYCPFVDLNSNTRYDMPAVPNTGTGRPNFCDMGALEQFGRF